MTEGSSDRYQAAVRQQGNPNFDKQGNYQGCHGIGCEVDTPDDDRSSNDDDSD
jgi:hypothetical protein